MRPHVPTEEGAAAPFCNCVPSLVALYWLMPFCLTIIVLLGRVSASGVPGPTEEAHWVSGRQKGGQGLQSDAVEVQLLNKVQAGDAAAFEALFKRYSIKVYRQAMHLLGNEAEAEEVMQEVFLTVYEKANTFRGDAAFSTWLYRLTVNTALSRLRRRQRRPEIFMDDYLPRFQDNGHHLVRPVVDWSHDLESDFARAETQRLLRQAIEALRPTDKAVVVLSDLEGFSQQEIGAVLGLSVSAVKARLHRARLFLRGRLAVALGYSPT
jgi:RNA polymerase sigma-70 factor (ECF subfamily)